MTPVTVEDVERLIKQNAMLMRALMKVKAERDALLKQLADKQAAEQQEAATP
jgi:hypothetical protein